MENAATKRIGPFRALQLFVADFILLSSGLALLAQFFPVAISLGAILSALRFNQKIRGAAWMFAVYWVLAGMTLDTAAMIAVMAVWSSAPSMFIAGPAAYAALLYARRRYGFLSHLTKSQLLIIPVFIWACAATVPAALSSYDGGGLPDNRLRIISPSHDGSVPMYIEPVPNADRAIVGYRLNPNGPLMDYEGRRPSVASVDLRTGRQKVWLDTGRPIALKSDFKTGETFTVVCGGQTGGTGRRGLTDLMVFDADGRLLKSINLGLSRDTYSLASIYFYRGDVVLAVEDNWFVYHRKNDRLVKLNSRFVSKNAPVYAIAGDGERIVGVFSPGYFFISLATGRRNLVSVDARTMKYVSSRGGPVYGYYDIERIPGSSYFVASHTWASGGEMINSSLELIRRINIPAGVRNIAIDSTGETLAAGGYYDGLLHIIDLKNNKKRSSVFAGKGIRGVVFRDDNHVLLGSKLGLVEVSLEAEP